MSASFQLLLMLGGGQTVSLSAASETDTAGALTYSRRLEIGAASESDTAATLTIARRLSTSWATEADTANGITISRVVPIAAATEVDTAGIITPVQATVVELGAASESDTAGGLTLTRRLTIGAAFENDTAAVITPSLTTETEETDFELWLAPPETLGVENATPIYPELRNFLATNFERLYNEITTLRERVSDLENP